MSKLRTLARSVTEVRIKEAAAQLFAFQGFKGTTTREIAKLADVNEATLFRHFPEKEILFWAATDHRLRSVKLSPDLITDLMSDADPGVVIPKIVTFMDDNFLRQPQMIRLIFVACFELKGAAQLVEEHLGPILHSFNAYFRRCTAKGLIPDINPLVVTLGMAGTVSAQYALGGILTENETAPITGSILPEYTQFLLSALSRQVS